MLLMVAVIYSVFTAQEVSHMPPHLRPHWTRRSCCVQPCSASSMRRHWGSVRLSEDICRVGLQGCAQWRCARMCARLRPSRDRASSPAWSGIPALEVAPPSHQPFLLKPSWSRSAYEAPHPCSIPRQRKSEKWGLACFTCSLHTHAKGGKHEIIIIHSNNNNIYDSNNDTSNNNNLNNNYTNNT